MMRVLIVFIFSVYGSATCTGQTYFNESSVWYEYHYKELGGSVKSETDYYRYYVKGDTIINNLKFLKIWKEGTELCRIGSMTGNQPDTFYIEINEYSGAIREESNLVYTVRPDQTAEELLYDYNWEIGDTIACTWWHPNPRCAVIDSIGLINLGSEQRKILFYNAPRNNPDFLIEGVGMGAGLFRVSLIGLEEHFDLICYEVDGEVYHISGNQECALDSISSIQEIGGQENRLELILFPNPVSSHIEIEGITVSDVDYSLFTSFGSLLGNGSINSDKSTSKIDVSILNPGLYFLVFRKGKKYQLHRFIKM